MTYSYLALGDSYTIGEQVPLHESFPYQTIQILRNKFGEQHHFIAPEIIAKTGWTTDELSVHISVTSFLPQYDFVSLLIGVNNQYRGRSVDNYITEFEELLKQAIHFAGGNNQHVFVISIPDWGVTPFAADRDREKITTEIDQYNKVCHDIASHYHSHFIEITTSQRIDGTHAEFLAGDGLHPSGKEYAKWAKLLSDGVAEVLG